MWNNIINNYYHYCYYYIYYNNIACARRYGCISFTAPPPALRTVLTVARPGTSSVVHLRPFAVCRPARHRRRGGLRSPPAGRWSISEHKRRALCRSGSGPPPAVRLWAESAVVRLTRIRQSSRSTSRVSRFIGGRLHIILWL